MLKVLLSKACAASSDPNFKGPIVTSGYDVTAPKGPQV
mgnify:CR=1 FL=1